MSSIILPAGGAIAASRRRTAAGTPTVLGYSTKGASTTAAAAGRMLVSSFALASAGTLTELHCWVSPGGSPGELRVVLYDDDGGSGLPGTRLAYSNGLTIPTSVSTEVSQSGFSVALAAGTYWVGFLADSSGNGSVHRETSGGTNQGILSGVTYTPPPSPFGTPNTSGAIKLSCWGVVLV